MEVAGGAAKIAPVLLAVGLAVPAVRVRADDPPSVEHQPSLCAVPGKAISLCAAISDDVEVAKARLYFRPAGDKFYSYVDMVFGGINYCGTLPAPREGKLKAIEYYMQAVDNAYQPTRTSTYQLPIQPEGTCEFPPLEKNTGRAAAIKVYGSHPKMGKKLPDEFDPTGVTFVPFVGK